MKLATVIRFLVIETNFYEYIGILIPGEFIKYVLSEGNKSNEKLLKEFLSSVGSANPIHYLKKTYPVESQRPNNFWCRTLATMELLNLAYSQIFRVKVFCHERLMLQEELRLKSYLLCEETNSKEYCVFDVFKMRLPKSNKLLSHELTKDRRKVGSIFYYWGKDYYVEQKHCVYLIHREEEDLLSFNQVQSQIDQHPGPIAQQSIPKYVDAIKQVLPEYKLEAKYLCTEFYYDKALKKMKVSGAVPKSVLEYNQGLINVIVSGCINSPEGLVEALDAYFYFSKTPRDGLEPPTK